MSEVLDTILNVSAFAYIGLMLWLYLKPSAIDKKDSEED